MVFNYPHKTTNSNDGIIYKDKKGEKQQKDVWELTKKVGIVSR